IAVSHVRVGHVAVPGAISAAERCVRRQAETEPHWLGLVVDGHARVVLWIGGYTKAFGSNAFHRPTIGPANVQRFLPDHRKVTVSGLSRGGDGRIGFARVFYPGRA